MIVLPSGARVWLACGDTDMRKGRDDVPYRQRLGDTKATSAIGTRC
jgi:metal-dependent HD superfamily phosphatase/phosphodiesterase